MTALQHRSNIGSMVRGSGSPIPLLWEHKADDPRNYVGDVVEATETDDGLAIKGRFDLDTEFGKSAYRNTKGRRVSGLSIGYAIRNSTNTAAGNELTELELIEVSIVARGANDCGSGELRPCWSWRGSGRCFAQMTQNDPLEVAREISERVMAEPEDEDES